MSVLVLSGPRMNLVARGTVTASSIDSDYPLAGLSDGRALRPFKFGSVLSQHYVDVDLQALTNGGLETGAGSTFTGWSNFSTGTGTIAQETGIPCVGSRAVKIGGGAAGLGWLEQGVVVRPGELWRLEVKLRGDGTNSAQILILDRDTGRFWTGSAWQSAITNCGVSQSGTGGPLTNGYTQHSVNFTMPDYSQYKRGEAHVSVILYVEQNGFGYFDDVVLYPAVSFSSVHGHQLVPSPGMTAILKSDDNSGFSSPTTRATFSISQPSFYSYFAAVYERYWRLEINGGQGWDSTGKPGIGEYVLGQYDSFDRGYDAPHMSATEDSRERAQARIETGAGDSYVFNRGSFERRTVKLPYSGGEDFSDEFIAELQHRSEGGLYPLVIVPDSARPAVILGRVEPSYVVRDVAWADAGEDIWKRFELPIRELAFPTWAA